MTKGLPITRRNSPAYERVTIEKRVCLRCGRVFPSTSKANRICPKHEDVFERLPKRVR